MRMRGGGEDRVFQQVFPIAREFLTRHHLRGDRPGLSAGTADDHFRARFQLCGIAHQHGGHTKGSQRLNKPETGGIVIGQRVPGHRAPIGGGQPDLIGFRDQIADSQHKPVIADHDTLTQALGAQRLRRESVGWYGCAQGYDR